MIFSAMAEELGFFRLLIVLLMYAILVIRGYRIAANAPDRFGFLVASGITTWIAIQTIINISVNIGLFPITGLTLPFISSGGTSLLTLLCAVGILLNISMYSTEEATLARRTKKQPTMLRNLFS
jgi:cell division protein FtsW